MPRMTCPECGVDVLVDPRGRCPEGHVVSATGTVGALFGAEPHPEEPQPWTFEVADDVAPGAPGPLPDAGQEPQPEPSPPGAPTRPARGSRVDDELVAALDAITDTPPEDVGPDRATGDEPARARHDTFDGDPESTADDDTDELTSLEAALAELGRDEVVTPPTSAPEEVPDPFVRDEVAPEHLPGGAPRDPATADPPLSDLWPLEAEPSRGPITSADVDEDPDGDRDHRDARDDPYGAVPDDGLPVPASAAIDPSNFTARGEGGSRRRSRFRH